MATLRASAEFYRRQQRLSVAAVVAGRRAWGRLDRDALDATRGQYQRLLLPVLATAQENAAKAGAAYVGAALAEQGIDVDPLGEVAVGAFAGRASDGRPLLTLLDQPVIRVKQRIGEGWAPGEAMKSGRALLDTITSTQVADAGRGAAGVGIAARPTVGYVRMLNPPSCSRCLILAGRWYWYSAGFRRHPRCDCVHVPSRENVAGDLRTDPRAYFDNLAAAEQDRLFGKDNAQAIRDGADMNRVENLRMPKRWATDARARLTPEAIYARAGSRDEAIRLLRLNGFLY